MVRKESKLYLQSSVPFLLEEDSTIVSMISLRGVVLLHTHFTDYSRRDYSPVSYLFSDVEFCFMSSTSFENDGEPWTISEMALKHARAQWRIAQYQEALLDICYRQCEQFTSPLRDETFDSAVRLRAKVRLEPESELASGVLYQIVFDATGVEFLLRSQEGAPVAVKYSSIYSIQVYPEHISFLNADDSAPIVTLPHFLPDEPLVITNSAGDIVCELSA